MPRARKTCETCRGGFAVVSVVKRDTHAALRKLQSDDAADSARRAGYQRDPAGGQYRRTGAGL